MNERRIPLRLEEYKPLREIVFEGMREAIVKQLLRPGERLMESRLAEEMGVSRTPIREALRRLELEGFIYVLPRKGAFVAGISIKDIRDLYEIRGALEALASGLAAQRAAPEEIEEMKKCLIRESELVDSSDITHTVNADVSLHDLIYKAARNKRLLNTLNNIREQIYRIRFVLTSLPGRKKASLEMHSKIVEAIGERNVELAQYLAEEHVRYAKEAMKEHYKETQRDEPS